MKKDLRLRCRLSMVRDWRVLRLEGWEVTSKIVDLHLSRLVGLA